MSLLSKVVDVLDANTVNTVEGSIGNVTVRQSDIGSLSYHNGGLVDVGATSWQTIFDFGSTVDVIGGVVNGNVPTQLRITWGDDSTDTYLSTSRFRGEDAGQDFFTVLPVPSIKAAKKLEFFNDAGATRTYGWEVATI